MKFFATLLLLCAIFGSALATSTTSTTESPTTTLAPATSGPSSPCGPKGPCGLLKCLGGAGGCGQKLYIFN